MDLELTAKAIDKQTEPRSFRFMPGCPGKEPSFHVYISVTDTCSSADLGQHRIGCWTCTREMNSVTT